MFPIALLLLAMASVQAGASIAKTLFPLIGPAGMVGVRIFFGTLVLAVVLRPWRSRIASGSGRSLLIYGLSLGVMNLLYYAALQRVPLGLAVAVEFTGPLAVAVFSSRRALDFCWIVLAAGGLLLLLPLGRDAGTAIDPLGAAYALGAGACWALYIIFGQKTGADHGARAVALGSTISATFTVPIGIVSAGRALFATAVLLPGIAVAVLSTALPYTLEMIALTRMPARTFGVLMSVEPVFGALFGYWYLRERLTGLQWIAMGLIILASGGAAASIPAKPVEPSPAPV